MNSPIGPSGWHPDPYGRFEYRYHNGTQWTADVSVHGQRFVDPQWVPGNTAVLTQRMLPVNTRSRAMAVTSFVVGIVSVLAAWLPFFFVAGAIGAVLAFVFGVIGIRKAATQDGHGRGFAVTGIVLSVVAALLCIVGFLFTRWVLREVDAYNNPGPLQAAVTSCEHVGAVVSMTATIRNLDTTTRDYVAVVAFEVNGNEARRYSVKVERVAPGETASFESKAFVAAGDKTVCKVVAVHGRAPFGVLPADGSN